MLSKLRPTTACPCTCKSFTILAPILIAIFTHAVMLFVGVLTQALKIESSMSWNVIKTLAFAPRSFTFCIFALRIEILMLFETMVAETFGLWTDHFTLYAFFVSPAKVKSIFGLLRNWKIDSFLGRHNIDLLIFGSLKHFLSLLEIS